MSARKPFTAAAAVIFLAIAVAHVLRIIGGWQVTVADTLVPLSVSWAAIAVAGGLGLMLLRESRR